MRYVRQLLPATLMAVTFATVAHADSLQPADGAAAPSAGARLHGRHGAFGHVLRQLNLTPEQKTQIQSIFAQAKPQLQALHSSSHANREQLATVPPNDPGYAALVASEQSAAAARVKMRADLWGQIYAVLTPAQQAAIPGVVAAEKAKWAARRAAWQQQRTAS